jgi:hypothetical protein
MGINMNSVRQVSVKTVESALLSAHGLMNATSTKVLGNMSFARDMDGTAPENFALLLDDLEIDAGKTAILFPKLTHSANVAQVAALPGRTGRILIDQYSPEVMKLAKFSGIDPPPHFIGDPGSGIDACISASFDTCLAILPADCAPVMLYDPVTGHYAIVHAGVLGAISGIVINTVNCMTSWCGTNPSDLVCYIGPCVTSDIYVLKLSGLWNTVLKEKIDERVAENFDLKEYIVKQLVDLGVPVPRIETSGFCTGRDAHLFFSNYSAKTDEEKRIQGRHLSLIGRFGEETN